MSMGHSLKAIMLHALELNHALLVIDLQTSVLCEALLECATVRNVHASVAAFAQNMTHQGRSYQACDEPYGGAVRRRSIK